MELGAYKIKQFSGDAADWPEWKMKFLSICRKEKCINAVKPGAAARSTVVGEVGCYGCAHAVYCTSCSRNILGIEYSHNSGPSSPFSYNMLGYRTGTF